MAFTKITGPGIHTLSNIMTHNVKSSGIITAVNGNLSGWLAVGQTASFGGDVSIGGTLTYDDVTNVESVGIITAKEGIHVGAAGTVLHVINDSNAPKVGIGTTIPTSTFEISQPSGTPSHIKLKRTSGNTGECNISVGGANPGVIFDAVGISSDFIFRTQGTEIMRIDSLNKEVGIGTDNPFSLLDVFRKATGTHKDIFSVRSHSGAFLVECSDVAASNPTWALRTFSGEDLVLSPGGQADLHEKVRIKASTGRVGMGLTSTSGGTCDPDDNGLLIRHSSTFQTNHGHIMLTGDGATVGEGPQIVFSESGSGGNFAGAYIGHVRRGGNSQGDLVFGTRDIAGDADTVPDERLRITKDGQVGINSSIPTNTLVVREPEDNNSSLQLFRESTGGDISSVIWATNQGNQAQINYRGGGGSVGMQFYTGGTGSSNLRAIIDTSGKVGIGTNAPNMTLHVKSTSDDVARFQSTNSGNGTAITLDHIGGSPADDDIVGKIVFNGQDDGYNSTTYADIRCITSDVSDGSETAHLDFGTRGLSAFNPILRLNARSTASAPSYTADDMNGIILDVYNTGNPYPRYMNFIAKSGGNTDSNIGFWTEAVGGSPTEKMRITSGGHVLFSGLTEVKDTRNPKGITIKSSSGGGGISFQNFGSNGSKNWRLRPDDLVGWGTLEFSVSPTTNDNTDWPDHADDVVLCLKPEKHVVIPNGRLGIGLNGTPSAKLDIANDSATGQLHLKHGWASRRFFSISIINNETRWYKICNYQAGNMLVGSLQIFTSRGGGFNQTKGYNEWRVSYGGHSNSIYGTAAENTSFQSGTGNSVDLVIGDSPENVYIKIPGSIYAGSVYCIFEGITANWQLDTDTYLTSAP